MRDVRRVVADLLQKPRYTISILTVLAVGFALLASTLAVVDGVLFKPLGYPNERDLVVIRLSSTRSKIPPTVSPSDVAAWAAAMPGVSFTGFLVFPVENSLKGRALVQRNFFDVLGTRPEIGGFLPQDFDGPQAIEPRIVTHEAFGSQLGSDPAALGRIVITDQSSGSGYRIVGVMPRGFVFPWDRVAVGYLTPYIAGRSSNYLRNHVLARLPSSVPISDVRSRVLVAAAAGNPAVDQVEVQPLSRALGAASRPLFVAFLAGAGLLLVVAAHSAMSLMAARSFDRRRELGVCRALGATSFHIGWLLLLETGFLIGGGAAVGLAFGALLLGFFVPLLPESSVLFRAGEIDSRVAILTVAVAVAIVSLATMLLLRQAMKHDASLEPGRTLSERTRSRSMTVLVTVQVALALMLSLAGSLLVASLLSVYAQTQPITTKGVIIIPAQFMDGGPVNWAGRVVPERAVRVDAVLQRLRTLPGVEAAAAVAADFLNGGYTGSAFVPPPTASKSRLVVHAHSVTADYYRVVEPQLVAGRLPTAIESMNNDPVIVVSELVAHHFWPTSPAVGQTLTDGGQSGLAFTVVGIVKDVRWFSWDGAETPTIYSPYSITARLPWPTLLIRTKGETSRVTADVLRAVVDADPLLRPGRPALLNQLFIDSVRHRRLQAGLFGSFATACLLVVGVGIFGQLTMFTARRTREVGVRIACGATRGSIVRLMLREQLVPVIAGLVVGGTATAWAVRFLRGYLYQVTPSDLRIWAVAIALILLTASAGTLVPARRASRLDPTRALRNE